MKIFNSKLRKHIRQRLRNEMPETELLLWSKLKGKQVGLKFRRQVSIGDYVVDFYCPSAKLVIEVDGDSHFEDQDVIAQDLRRQHYIESLSIVVLRFTNDEVRDNIEGVIEMILKHLPEQNPLGPSEPGRSPLERGTN